MLNDHCENELHHLLRSTKLQALMMFYIERPSAGVKQCDVHNANNISVGWPLSIMVIRSCSRS